MQFDWDPDKAAKNSRKHKIDFAQATRVFLDSYHYEYDQVDDDDGVRHNIVGIADGFMLHVTYTMRGDTYRIISARPANRHERKRYHEV